MPRRAEFDPVLQAYVDHLNGIINATVSESRLVLLELERAADLRQIVRFQEGERLPLALRPRGYLHFRQLVRRVADHVQVSEELYIFSESSDPDDEAAWIIRYEYDRVPIAGKPQAHLHVNAERKGVSLRHIHFPTGRISVEQLLAHLIFEHGIEPLSGNAMGILAESHKGFTSPTTDQEEEAFP